MTLHIINQSPRRSDALQQCPIQQCPLQQCLSVCQPDDAILLIEGALELLKDESLTQRLLTASTPRKFFALLPDDTARAMTINMLKNVQPIDYKTFVELVVEHHPIVSW